jgi:hypothetical protein
MTVPSKWTAFLLSAVVPGAGQLAARSWTCLSWFAAAALVAAVFAQAGPRAEGTVWLVALQLVVGAALCLVSAEHAKRLLETGRNRRDAAVTSSRVNCAGGTGRQVNAEIQLAVARSADEVWEIVGDLPRFLTIDPFHDRVTLMRDRPGVGVDLVLSHNAFGRRFLRFGRIVAWQEKIGYTLSDLSARGPRVGFPHVFTVRIEPLDRITEGASADVAADVAQPASQLTIRIRGRWTSRLIPVWVGRQWISLVCREHARLLRKGL